MKYNSEYQYILMLLESVKPRVYGWTLPRKSLVSNRAHWSRLGWSTLQCGHRARINCCPNSVKAGKFLIRKPSIFIITRPPFWSSPGHTEKWPPIIGQHDKCFPGSDHLSGSRLIIHVIWRPPVKALIKRVSLDLWNSNYSPLRWVQACLDGSTIAFSCL